MDTTQIRQLVAAKIAEQGTNVDAGSALPDIINGLCDIIDNLPAPQELPIVEITEDITGDPVEISRDRAFEILDSGILLYDGMTFVASTGNGEIGLPDHSVVNYIFINTFGLDDEYSMNGYRAIMLWLDDQSEFYIQYFEV